MTAVLRRWTSNQPRNPVNDTFSFRIMQGKVIVISGGAGGIGAEVSARLAAEGARLVIADLNAAQAEAQAAAIEIGGSRALGVACDITNPEECEALAQAAVKEFGRLDGMVNCAGFSKPHDSISLPPVDWARMVDVQLNGAFYFAQACAKRMMEMGGGAIVFMTSTNAEAAFPRRAAYCCAKAGVAMLTKVLAIEWAEKGIRVNAVGPAYVATEMTQRNIAAGNVNEAQIKGRIPLGRLAQPADVADAVSFLLSEKASFITGHSLYVDGGWLAYGYF
jgi:NAD(P)-dependent dehydrogenase (short-subunit alcohol dehydrogenase family)